MDKNNHSIDKMLQGKWQYPQNLSKWHEHIEGYCITGCSALSESNLVFIFRKITGNGPVIKLIRFYRDETPQFSGETFGKIKDISYTIGLDHENSLWVSMAGDVFYLGKNNETSDTESPIPDRSSEFGYRTIKGLERVGTTIYAAASWRHIFKRTGKNNWQDITENIDRSDIIDKKGGGWNTKKAGYSGFRCIGGITENNLYAAGNGGDCWHFDGNIWRRIDLPTNECVYKIVAVNPDLVYMACGGGVLLEGAQDTWRVIKYENDHISFTEMVLFQDVLYVATDYSMYKLVDGELVNSRPASENFEIEMFTHHSLSANEDIMLMCGETSVAISDGEFWLPFAPNGPITGDTTDDNE